eukprot:3462154-Rhodomonas_salina.1
MMLGTAAAAMVTVSIVDLFLHISEGIGMDHTVLCSSAGAATVLLFKFFAPLVLPAEDDTDVRQATVAHIADATMRLTSHALADRRFEALASRRRHVVGFDGAQLPRGHGRGDQHDG